MKITVGSAPDSWGIWFPSDPRQMPWNRFLDEISAVGYEWTELGPYGYLPSDPKVLAPELAKRNLKVTGSFVMGDLARPDKSWDEMLRQLHGWGPLFKELNAKFVVLIDQGYTDHATGAVTDVPRLDKAGFQRLVDTTHRIAEIAKKDYGLTLVFHNHAQTHVEFEDQVEDLLAKTDPDLVSLVLDIGHYAYCKGDPIELMRRHHKRIPYLHLKSVDAAKRDKVLRDNIPFATAVAEDVFVEPSKGAVDFTKFRDVLKEVDYVGYGMVEQDMFPAPFDKPLPIAKRTRAYLREIGIG
jgi:inosose dehydratase